MRQLLKLSSKCEDHFFNLNNILSFHANNEIFKMRRREEMMVREFLKPFVFFRCSSDGNGNKINIWEIVTTL